MNTDFEDKKCRLCGHADADNENIFYTRDRFLVKKIAAVFSIWVTPNDPLPKCICPKCFGKVTSIYKSYNQVKKLQNKWLENVAIQQPNNNYVQVLDFIERANMSIKNFIETNYREKLCKDVIENLLIGALSGIHENPAGTVVPNSYEQANSNSNYMSNGTMDTYEISTFKTEATASDDEENLSLAEIATNTKTKLTPIPEDLTEIECKYCALKFQGLKKLAEHQVIHMKLSVPKLFQPKFLNKNFRRGRLISVQSRQSIRCLNCYLVFDDNKCILEHWSKAECDFYCQICGEEFAQSPKLLREHVAEVHGISYRSLKMQRDLSFLSTSSMQPMNSKLKQKLDSNSTMQRSAVTNSNQPSMHKEVSSSMALHLRPPDRPIKCRICKRDFRNFKARNSHMRAHKPPYAYNDIDQLPKLHTDAYMEPEPIGYEITPPLLMPMSQIIPAPFGTSTPTSSSINVSHLGVPIETISSATTASKNNTEQLLIARFDNTEPTDMELDTIQTSSSNNINCYTNSNFHNSNTMINPPPLSPSTSKSSSSTAPRGIRMKFVNRRTDISGGSPAIKVKSINDLKATQSITCPPQHTTLEETKPIISASTCPPENLKPNQTITTYPPPPYSPFENLKPNNQHLAAHPPPPYHTSVIVNSLQNQPNHLFNPQIHQNTVMPATVKDEPLELI